ncbi:four helix bundle protein [Patescibacteria group bacterium]|nr:four helix bundle protein [Patescibacteria group bacterium]
MLTECYLGVRHPSAQVTRRSWVKFKKEFKNRLYNWVLRLIKFIDKLPKDSVCNVMGKQLLKSGTSILANYVEANSASSKKNFINFFTHSLKSANESKVWLALLRDTKKGNLTELKWLLEELTETANILASSLLTLKGKK